MKKVTLMAIVWALTMMGCSESGMDNSAASTTSEVSNVYELKLDETPKLFSRSVKCDDMQSLDCYIEEEIRGHRYIAMLRPGVGNNEAFSELDLDLDGLLYVIPDFVHIYTACVQDCDDFGNCAVAKTPEPYFKSKRKIATITSAGGTLGVGPHHSCGSMFGKVGVVSIFAVVYNAGKSDEVVLQGSTYINLKRDQALWVYRNYIYPQQLAEAGL